MVLGFVAFYEIRLQVKPCLLLKQNHSQGESKMNNNNGRLSTAPWTFLGMYLITVHGPLVCEFTTYLLKFGCNPQINTSGAFGNTRMAEDASVPVGTFSSEVEQGSKDSKRIWGRKSIIYLYNISQLNFTV